MIKKAIATFALAISIAVVPTAAFATSAWDSLTLGSLDVYDPAVSSSALDVSNFEDLIDTVAPTTAYCNYADPQRHGWKNGAKNARVVVQYQNGTAYGTSTREIRVFYSVLTADSLTMSFAGSGTSATVQGPITSGTNGYGYKLRLLSTSTRPDKLDITCISGVSNSWVGTAFSYRTWPISTTTSVTYPAGYAGATIPVLSNPDAPVEPSGNTGQLPPASGGGTTDVSNLVSKEDIKPIFKVLGGSAAVIVIGGALLVVVWPFLRKAHVR